MYVYLKIQELPGRYVYTVGFYAPGGKWVAESDCETSEQAAARVHYLNGGGDE